MNGLTVGQRIAERRKMLGISQEGLGEKMGVSRQAISKWEADAAVPEIDKLIAMSRLFGVTVGWLLGTEKESTANEELTEQQLKMVEQIVKRYQSQTAADEFTESQRGQIERIVKDCQPQPAPKEKKSVYTWLKLLAAVAAVILIGTAFHDVEQRLDQNASFSSSLSSSYSTIQSQLSILASRLDELAAGEKILSEYTAEAEAWDDKKGAVITFAMTPKSRHESDNAYVAVRHPDTEVERFACRWDGTAYKADASVSARDGYEFYYIVCHADGTQEQELMTRTGYEDLAMGLQGSFSVTACYPEIKNGSLCFYSYDLNVTAPTITSRTEAYREEVYLDNIEWVLLVNEQVHHREDIFTYFEWDYTTNLQTGGSGLHEFRLPATSDGDSVKLCMDISLSDGTQKRIEVAEFTLENGAWLRNYPVTE